MARLAFLLFAMALLCFNVPASGGRGLRRMETLSKTELRSLMNQKIEEDPKEKKKHDKKWYANKDLNKGEKQIPENNIDEEPGRRNADRNKTVPENVTKHQDPEFSPDFG